MNSFDQPVQPSQKGKDGRGKSLTVDVFFDFICPWCWIGTRHLSSALSAFEKMHPEVKTKVRWRSYPLLPDTPEKGVPYQTFYLSRLGSATAVSMGRAQVERAGQAVGIHFDFSRISVLPNTQRAHGVIKEFRRVDPDVQLDVLIDRIFGAYFNEGADIGDQDVLQRLKAEHDAAKALAPPTNWSSVSRQTLRGVAVPGVPYFIFNSDVSISGAHNAGALLHAMRHAVSKSQ
ncbi:hypothetical protein LMG7141_02354 [Ralstonia condita]|uniref:DSBA-like thioredoxin domain-containing protein n=1 Tax=Ralstonia condita TaxID=3058600 RepID=A0ABM9JD60_9RALS|nr:DsbA family oxidoreductase [Ralstonia sp. LMG 7141]CAJ0790355.1 hypothetical protein LMG7141_02354 [Ralstonia sp. LMG 7141]